MMMPEEWMKKLGSLFKSFESKGFWVKFSFTPPMSQEQIEEIEGTNNIKLPLHLRQVVNTIAASCHFEWSTNGPSEKSLPEGFEMADSGGESHIWDVKQVRSISNTIFEDYGFDPRHILQFMYTGNGDIIALDSTAGLSDASVIYINHDGGTPGFIDDDRKTLHGHRLGLNFVDFMNRWIDLGCPGNEYDGLLPFYDFEKSILRSSDDPKVSQWIQWLHE
jgi:hypothetical protein